MRLIVGPDFDERAVTVAPEDLCSDRRQLERAGCAQLHLTWQCPAVIALATYCCLLAHVHTGASMVGS